MKSGIRLTADEAKAVLNLRTDKDFAVVLAYLERILHTHTEFLVYAEDSEATLRSQGRVQVLNSVLEQIASARSTLEYYDQPRT